MSKFFVEIISRMVEIKDLRKFSAIWYIAMNHQDTKSSFFNILSRGYEIDFCACVSRV